MLLIMLKKKVYDLKTIKMLSAWDMPQHVTKRKVMWHIFIKEQERQNHIDTSDRTSIRLNESLIFHPFKVFLKEIIIKKLNIFIS